MFGSPTTLVKIYGFEIQFDPSWLFLVVLLIWSFGGSYYPANYPDLSSTVHWTMAAVSTTLLFVSLVLHEMAHSVVARRLGIPVRGIVLFIFGGVANIEKEPQTAADEFQIAIAGPLASLAIGTVLLLVWRLVPDTGSLSPVSAIAVHIGTINIILAVFNLLPAFPLDGGRVLRAVLWTRGMTPLEATRRATAAGRILASAMMIAGGMSLFSGIVVGGLWWFLIGLFLYTAALASDRQANISNVLRDEQVGSFMTQDPIFVGPDLSLSEFMERIVLRFRHTMFPVVSQGRLIGLVNARDTKGMSASDLSSKRVQDILVPLSEKNAVAPNLSASTAFDLMSKSPQRRLLVVKGSQLMGIVALSDLMQYVALRLELFENNRS